MHIATEESFVLDDTQVLHLEGHTEITLVFKEFERQHPAAKRYETRLDPAPWSDIYSQPFKHVPNEKLEELRLRWKKQLDSFMAKPDQNSSTE